MTRFLLPLIALLLAADVTVAEVLKQAGYATGGFGKWGVGDHGTPGVAYLWHNDTRFYPPGNAARPEDGLVTDHRNTYSADVIWGAARDFVKQREKGSCLDF